MKPLLAVVFFSLAGFVRAEEPRKSLPPAQVKQAFMKLLDRGKVSADVKALDEPKAEGGLVTEHFSFASEKKADGSVERVPVLLVRPEAQGKFPAVIVLHGTGGNKDGQKSWLVDLAKRGIIGLAIDARYHGERAGGAKGSAAYVAAITQAWRTPKGQPVEHPFYYDTCWDLWRTLDYLQTRPDVDPERLGMIGTSMGGIETWLAGSVDERVKVAVPLIAVQSFRWSLENDRWQGRARTIAAAHEAAAKDLGEPMVNAKVCRALWGKVIPGILDDFDCPNMIRLFVGRPLLIANGELDQNCPIEGARLAFAAAEDAFAKAGAKEKLHIVTGRGGHTVTPEFRQEAMAWCEKWLGR
jgi:dienelactone hydrolase